jgi:hypothetical protein
MTTYRSGNKIMCNACICINKSRENECKLENPRISKDGLTPYCKDYKHYLPLIEVPSNKDGKDHKHDIKIEYFEDDGYCD